MKRIIKIIISIIIGYMIGCYISDECIHQLCIINLNKI